MQLGSLPLLSEDASPFTDAQGVGWWHYAPATNNVLAGGGSRRTLMDSNRTSYVLGSEDGEFFWGVDGSLWTLKASAEQTGGKFSLIEEFGQLQEGTPLHVHHEDDEAFYVLEGELMF